MGKTGLIVKVVAGLALAAAAFAQDQDEPLRADPANDLFRTAQEAYQDATKEKNPARQKELFLSAIRWFDRFHHSFPTHPNSLRSWYYSAVCYQKVGNTTKFRGCLSKVVTTWKEGPLVGAAAYQLAHEHYRAKQYAPALPLFALAAAQSDNPDYRHRAIYSRALCFEKLDRRPEYIEALKAVLTDQGSPHHLTAERVLAHTYKEDKRNEEALAHFINLAKSEDRTTRADATLQCALLARELGKKEFARRYFEAILTTPGLEEWRGEAQLSLMSEASLANKHQSVVDYYKKGNFKLEKDQQARRLQLVAKAYDALGDKAKAVAAYNELQKIAPNEMTAFEAGYVVLTQEYKTGGRNLIRKAEEFLRRFEAEQAADPRIHNARLMVAEGYYKEKKFAPAAAAYAVVDLKHIATENHPGLRYRLATALLESGDRPAALAAFETFLEKHPKDARATNAIMKRADTFLADGKTTEAHAEFDRLIAAAKDADLREYAWAKKAVLYKEANDLDNFARCHTRLIADFPKRTAKKNAASEFWIGWALFRQDKFDPCLPRFERARNGDPGALGRESTLHIALANYSLQNRDALRTELDRLLNDYPNEQVPRPVFAWLGTAFASDEQYAEAWSYLKHAITPERPTQTKVVVWRAAGRSALESGAFEAALRPLDIVLQVEDNQFRKAETHFFLARAHFGLKAFGPAKKAAEACLELKPQGVLNAQTRLLLGDVGMAQGDPATAAQHFVVVVEFYSKEPDILLPALRKAISALELKGDDESLKSARAYRERLENGQKAAAGAPRD